MRFVFSFGVPTEYMNTCPAPESEKINSNKTGENEK